MTKYRKYTKRRRLRKRRGTKRRLTKRRETKRRQYGGQVGVDTNPNELNDEEKILERQSRLVV